MPNAFTWLYQTYSDIVLWATTVSNFLLTPVWDVLPEWARSLILVQQGIDSELVQTLIEYSVFGFCLGVGVGTWLVVTLLTWILDVIN